MSQPAGHLKIDFVSDVVCPWCAVGLNSLNLALDKLRGEIAADIHFQPFELNPQMVAEGENVVEHIAHKYGSTPEQVAQNQEALRQRGAAVGFTFNLDKRDRIYNTFDAHRLLHWAELEGKQAALKQALLEAYFTQGENVSSRDVLASTAASVGLDEATARLVLEENRYAEDVREKERFYQSQGIHSVPSIIVNERYLIQGGQPPGRTRTDVVHPAAGPQGVHRVVHRVRHLGQHRGDGTGDRAVLGVDRAQDPRGGHQVDVLGAGIAGFGRRIDVHRLHGDGHHAPHIFSGHLLAGFPRTATTVRPDPQAV